MSFWQIQKNSGMVVVEPLCCIIRRKLKKKDKEGKEREEKRALGMVILRGEVLESISLFGPAQSDDARRRGQAPAAPGAAVGVAKVAGRGMMILLTCFDTIRCSVGACSRTERDRSDGWSWSSNSSSFNARR